jgi:hypothetical protein
MVLFYNLLIINIITNATDSKKQTKNEFLKKCVSMKNTVNQTELYETKY